jgi:thymidylate kinase
MLKENLSQLGFRVELIHYGGLTESTRSGFGQKLLEELDYVNPVRIKSGEGGFEYPYHAYIETLLRFSKEFYDEQTFLRPALEQNDIVLLDRGWYTTVSYCLAVIKEQYPQKTYDDIYHWLDRVSSLWSTPPDYTLYLDVPIPISLERKQQRAGKELNLERKLFYPHLKAAYRYLTEKSNIDRIPVQLETPEAVHQVVCQKVWSFLGIEGLPILKASLNKE